MRGENTSRINKHKERKTKKILLAVGGTTLLTLVVLGQALVISKDDTMSAISDIA